MFFLILTILCSAMISIAMRLSEGRSTGKYSVLAANYVTCMLLSGFSVGWGNIFPNIHKAEITLALGVVNGVFYLLGLVFMQCNIKQNGVVLSSVFSRLGGLLVPLAVAICLFEEVPTIAQSIGSLIAVGSIILINFDKEKAEANAKWMLLLLFASDGCAAAMAKVFGELGNHNLMSNYLFYTFTTALILCIVCVLYKKEKLSWIDAVFGILIGIPNFFASRFLLKALESIPAVIAYPTRGVGGIVVIALSGILFFRERLKMRQWIAIGTILIAVVLLNIN